MERGVSVWWRRGEIRLRGEGQGSGEREGERGVWEGLVGGMLVDTGFFAVGRLVGRLVVEGAVLLSREVRGEVLVGLVEVLEGGVGREGWAVEGEILSEGGGGSGEEGEGLVVVGRWQLWVGAGGGLRIEDGEKGGGGGGSGRG